MKLHKKFAGRFLFDYVNEFFNYVCFKYMQKVTN